MRRAVRTAFTPGHQADVFGYPFDDKAHRRRPQVSLRRSR